MNRVFIWLIAIILTLIVASLGFAYFSPGYSMYQVMSESMKPAINMGDIVIAGPLGGPLASKLDPGTIITYKRGEELITHRVVALEGNNLITKGDAVEDPDSRLVAMSQITGVYLVKIPYAGYLSNFARTRNGWFVAIIIPAMLLVTLIVKDIVKEALCKA